MTLLEEKLLAKKNKPKWLLTLSLSQEKEWKQRMLMKLRLQKHKSYIFLHTTYCWKQQISKHNLLSFSRSSKIYAPDDVRENLSKFEAFCRISWVGIFARCFKRRPYIYIHCWFRLNSRSSMYTTTLFLFASQLQENRDAVPCPKFPESTRETMRG